MGLVLSTNALVYALADKYQIDVLKKLACDKFTNAAARDWQSKAFAQAAELTCETTPKVDVGLRNVVVATVNSHRGLMEYEEIQELLDS